MSGRANAAQAPTILFGAFDRHNFGDLLFAHIAAALLPGREILFAGLARRDLRACGGHLVESIAQLRTERAGYAPNLIHVGGEVLDCDAWQAAVMLQDGDRARDLVARLDRHPAARLAWAQRALDTRALAPYCLARADFPGAATLIYNAVGGVALEGCDAALRAEVLGKLRSADVVSVRDRRTLAQLEAAGVAARLVPDPVVMVAELFGERIRDRARSGEVARILAGFPQGFVAVQFGADFGDDATLDAIAAQLDRLAAATGAGIAFFCAGIAPWHDDPGCYARAAGRLRRARATRLDSIDPWDICALIAAGRACVGSSLHARIVAMAFAVPRLSLRHPRQASAPKQAAFAEAWDTGVTPATITVDEIAGTCAGAMGLDREPLRRHAQSLARRYREGFAAVQAALR